ncbi:MAG: FHA domain-containing protein [Proteobacteria bacterium]|nr:FHA domain-containing protein [Pseudomonadota bacterium]
MSDINEDTQGVATEEAMAFPINQALLDEATHAKEEWRLLKERLNKIEEHRSQVTKAVYEKVRGDYEGRLKAATEVVMSKKGDVDAELATLCETRNKIAEDLKVHQHNLEEIKFRRTLGEFADEEYQSQAREEQDKIGKFETVLSAVNSNIHRYEAIFADEPGLFAEEHRPAAGETVQEAELSGLTPTPQQMEPPTDEKGYVIEDTGPNYFGATKAEDTNPMFEEGSTTARGAAGKAETGMSRIIIINGDNAGATYPIKGTISLGRAESNTIAIRDAKVSRQHAQVQQQGKECVIVDLNSSNGTYVNNERIEEHVLSDGDEVRIGDCIMQFQA